MHETERHNGFEAPFAQWRNTTTLQKACDDIAFDEVRLGKGLCKLRTRIDACESVASARKLFKKEALEAHVARSHIQYASWMRDLGA